MSATVNILADIARTLDAQAHTMKVLAAGLLEISKQPGMERFVPETPFEEVKPEAETKAAPEKPAMKYDDLRKLCAAVAAAGKTADIKAIINEVGVTKLSEVPENKWVEVYEKIKAIKEGS